MTTRSFASVSRVQARLRKLLEPALNAKPFWLRAELSSVRESGGRLYCELVETKRGQVVAKFRCAIWGRELLAIKERLRVAKLDGILEDGNEVGLCCQVQYHPLYGMSLTAVDIDPSESLGALERKKQEIVAKLQADGLIGKNARHHVPLLPKRIGLVASHGSAGFKDFVSTIEASGYAISIFIADARVEGADTERSMLSALKQLTRLDLDLIVILRGGGSRLSLSHMDNEAIARAIAAHQRPVWTAIGHEIDHSVLDIVAHSSFKTPTAVAEKLVANFGEADKALRTSSARLVHAVTMRLRPERLRIESSAQRLTSLAKNTLNARKLKSKGRAEQFRLLVQGVLSNEDKRLAHALRQLETLAKQHSSIARRSLAEHRKSLTKTAARALSTHASEAKILRTRLLGPAALGRLRNESQRCDAWKQILRAADPTRNLERGYALVYNETGAIVRTTEGLEAGQRLRTQLASGSFSSVVDCPRDDQN